MTKKTATTKKWLAFIYYIFQKNNICLDKKLKRKTSSYKQIFWGNKNRKLFSQPPTVLFFVLIRNELFSSFFLALFLFSWFLFLVSDGFFICAFMRRLIFHELSLRNVWWKSINFILMSCFLITQIFHNYFLVRLILIIVFCYFRNHANWRKQTRFFCLLQVIFIPPSWFHKFLFFYWELSTICDRVSM